MPKINSNREKWVKMVANLLEVDGEGWGKGPSRKGDPEHDHPKPRLPPAEWGDRSTSCSCRHWGEGTSPGPHPWATLTPSEGPGGYWACEHEATCLSLVSGSWAQELRPLVLRPRAA